MRHAGSLFLSLFLAPLIWVAAGYGIDELARTRAQLAGGFEAELLLGLAALVAAGALYAVLVMPRLSPIGPALIGLIFLGLTGWAVFDPSSYYDTMPTELRDGDLALSYPAALGFGALLAVPLLATLLSPRRWRRFATAPAAGPAYGAPMGAPGGPVPPYGLQPGAVPPPPAGFGATPGYLSQPLSPPPPGPPPLPQRPVEPAQTTAFPAAPPAPRPTSAPPAPTSAPPVLTPPTLASPFDQPTTRLNPPPAPPPPSPSDATTRITAPAQSAEPTTTRLNAPDGEATQLLKGPPPRDAYPRPAWSAPTPPPITPPGPRQDQDDDPEATQPSR